MPSPPLTEDQVQVLRRQVGDRPTTQELQDIYDRTGSLTATAREILEVRLANYQADPASFSVHGEYSQDTGTNIAALQKALAELGDLDSGDSSLLHLVRRTRVRRELRR